MSSGAAIVSDKQLGDVLLLQPSAAYLAEQSGIPTALFVRDAFRPLIELMPGCSWGPDAKPPFQQVWATNWSSRAVWQAFKLRTRQRLLLINKERHNRWWYRLLFHKIRCEQTLDEYWARYFWRVVSGISTDQFTAPRLQSPPEAWRHPQEPEPGFLLINPTAAWSRKYWGVHQWAETLRTLSRNYPWPIVLAGGGTEREKAHCQAITEAVDEPILNLAGQTSMRQYLHLLGAARLVLCIDGAASHLAQALQVPTITLFGPTHEGKWHWPTPQHKVLAARHFVEGRIPPAGEKLSAELIPTSAVLETIPFLLKP